MNTSLFTTSLSLTISPVRNGFTLYFNHHRRLPPGTYDENWDYDNNPGFASGTYVYRTREELNEGISSILRTLNPEPTFE